MLRRIPPWHFVRDDNAGFLRPSSGLHRRRLGNAHRRPEPPERNTDVISSQCMGDGLSTNPSRRCVSIGPGTSRDSRRSGTRFERIDVVHAEVAHRLPGKATLLPRVVIERLRVEQTLRPFRCDPEGLPRQPRPRPPRTARQRRGAVGATAHLCLDSAARACFADARSERDNLELPCGMPNPEDVR